MKKLDIYVFLVFSLKITFVIVSIYGVFLNHQKTTNQAKIDKNKRLKKAVEFLFVLLMSFLLIYLFDPRKDRISLIDSKAKMLLFLFGFILIVTANWDVIVYESKFTKQLSGLLGTVGSS